MKAFVTGGSGFVGRNLIQALIARGDDVCALARSDSSADAVQRSGAVPVRGDLDTVEAMTEGMRGCDVVFHAAAHVYIWGDREEFMRINVQGTKNVIEAAKAANVPTFVHVSTEAALLGSGPLVNVDETRPLPEKNIGLYSETKALAERAVLDANCDELRAVAIRPPLIWGKGDTSVLPQVVAAVKAGQFMWFGGGRYPHTTTHVKNVVEGLLLAAEKGRGGEVYFVTDGEPKEFRWFMTNLLETQGVTPPNMSIPYPIALGIAYMCEFIWNTFGIKSQPPLTRGILGAMGEPISCIDTKAREELGYTGTMTHEEGFAEMRTS